MRMPGVAVAGEREPADAGLHARQPKAIQSAFTVLEEVARCADTIPYELLCAVRGRVRFHDQVAGASVGVRKSA